MVPDQIITTSASGVRLRDEIKLLPVKMNTHTLENGVVKRAYMMDMCFAVHKLWLTLVTLKALSLFAQQLSFSNYYELFSSIMNERFKLYSYGNILRSVRQ